MEEKKISPVYKVIKWLVKLFYPKIQVVGAEKLPDEPVIIVGNHCQTAVICDNIAGGGADDLVYAIANEIQVPFFIIRTVDRPAVEIVAVCCAG